MNARSTERVQRYRERQQEAGRKRITIYVSVGTQSTLEKLAGNDTHAHFLESLVKNAIERECAALALQQENDPQAETALTTTERERVKAPTVLAVPSGRRRNLANR